MQDDDSKDKGRIEIGPLCPPLKPMFFPWDESMDYLINKKENEDESSSQST